jgi:hypothetical protein
MFIKMVALTSGLVVLQNRNGGPRLSDWWLKVHRNVHLFGEMLFLIFLWLIDTYT